MQKAKCPHCQKEIRLLSAGDMDEEYGITANVLQHAREVGSFPDPWISFGNRNIFLAADIEHYAEDRARAKTEKTINELKALLDALPNGEREQALESLAGDDSAPAKQRATK